MKQEYDTSLTFWQHTSALRKVLIHLTVAMFSTTLIVFIFKDFVFNQIILLPRTADFFTNKILCNLSELLKTPSLCINQMPLPIVNIDISGQFVAHLKVSFWLGVLLASPVIIFEVARFTKPALTKNELKAGTKFIVFASVMLILGLLFGYLIIVPITVHFFSSYQVSNQIVNQINLNSYISTVLNLILSAGVAFELPVAIHYLSEWGIVNAKMLSKYRRHAVIIILTIAAIITPPDMFSMVIVAVPLYFLFEISVLTARTKSTG